uniref:uncharacterized protein LOC100177807 isoform X2 n=1 Tax=Ciona intestinalis TaxID=7719 RepID=UPI00089DAA01|nr:uncharacterized protein LOC100177807 isoform X2 [Ciona intestinalis]|eukprot:XP_018666924.1 uncharacterized protein LOC100177807 isoform X2 [Ciona intestinalis]
MYYCFLFVFLYYVTHQCNGYSSGNIPLSVCSTMTPNHPLNSPQGVVTSPFHVSVQYFTYIPDHDQPVYLSSSTSATFKGFYVQGRASLTNDIIGRFNVSAGPSSLTTAHNCPSTVSDAAPGNAVSHNSAWSQNASRPSSLTLHWSTRRTITTDAVIRATFVQSYTTYWVGVQSVVLKHLPSLTTIGCCNTEKVNTTTPSFCQTLNRAQENDEHNASIVQQALQISETLAESEAATVIRCFLWSSGSSERFRQNVTRCCKISQVSLECQTYCSGSFYATYGSTTLPTIGLLGCVEQFPIISTCLIYPNHILSNTTVTCQPGFQLFNGVCVDTDECFSPSACVPNALCMNTFGSYNCICSDGYTGNGRHCTDINECLSSSNSLCDPNAFCNNTVGSFNCICFDGYTGNGTVCTDLDECMAGSPCHLNAQCNNTIGSFTCKCKTGYTGNGTHCSDINECLTPTTCHSNAQCRNTVGSFTCNCSQGYVSNGFQCFDINECLSMSTNNCHMNATCSNTDGGFICFCNSGFTGDGVNCQVLATPAPLPLNAVVFEIITTININFTSPQKANAIINLDKELLVVALAPIPGYHSVRKISDRQGSVIVTSEAIFTTSQTGSVYNVPSLMNIRNSINQRANSINYLLPGNIPINPSIPVNRRKIAGNTQCQPTTCPPVAGYNVRCVDVGLSSFSCVCSTPTMEVPCSASGLSSTRNPTTAEVTQPVTTPAPTTPSGLHPGIIAGIVVGVVLILTVVGVVVYCKYRKEKDSKPSDIDSTSHYVEPNIFVEPVYMEVANSTGKRNSVRTSSDGYLDISEAFYNVGASNDSTNQLPVLASEAGYEEPMKLVAKNQPNVSPALPRRNKPLMVAEDEDGYLKPPTLDATMTDTKDKEMKDTNPQENYELYDKRQTIQINDTLAEVGEYETTEATTDNNIQDEKL